MPPLHAGDTCDSMICNLCRGCGEGAHDIVQRMCCTRLHTTAQDCTTAHDCNAHNCTTIRLHTPAHDRMTARLYMHDYTCTTAHRWRADGPA